MQSNNILQLSLDSSQRMCSRSTLWPTHDRASHVPYLSATRTVLSSCPFDIFRSSSITQRSDQSGQWSAHIPTSTAIITPSFTRTRYSDDAVRLRAFPWIKHSRIRSHSPARPDLHTCFSKSQPQCVTKPRPLGGDVIARNQTTLVSMTSYYLYTIISVIVHA